MNLLYSKLPHFKGSDFFTIQANKMQKLAIWSLILILFSACNSQKQEITLLGRFDIQKDLLLAQFDCKTDVDDLHSVAGLGTLLRDVRFADINYHGVAGSYGTQEGLYVPANELFINTFGKRWSDAYANHDKALAEVTDLVTKVLKDGGNVWIPEAGQSDFSAAMVRNIQATMPKINTKERIHIVQHSDWNEKVTSAEALAFVKENTNYHKIDDGNFGNNGTPQFRSEGPVDWQSKLTNSGAIAGWNLAISIGDQYNGKDGRYENKDVTNGGLDFSDLSETCWIFGFEGLKDYDAFFDEFGKK